MKKHNILKRITALFLSLIIFASLSVFSLAETVTTEAIDILSTVNAGGITINNVSISDGIITVSGDFDGAVNETITYLVYDNNKNIIDIGETSSDSSNNFSIEFGLKEFYESVLVELKGAESTEKASVEFSVIDAEGELLARISAVENLIAECENKGIKTDYEMVKLATAKKVLSELTAFLANGEDESYSYNIQIAINLLDEAEESLNGYLDGSLAPKEVVRTATSTPEISGMGFISDTEDGDRKPAFYVGYGHWDYSDLSIYKDLGVNLYQYEIGPNKVLKRSAPVKYWELSDYHSNLSNRLKYTAEYSTDGGSVELNASGSGEVYISQTVDVKPNTTYTFGFSFKCTSASSVWIQANGATNVRKWVYDANNDSTVSSWKMRSYSVTTGENQTEMTIKIGSHNNMSALKYDNVFLKESGSNANLLKNGDFSSQSTSEFIVNEAALDEIREVFKTAEDNNVSIVFLTAMHYFPTFVYDLDETVVNGDESTFGDFMPYNPTHPLVLETLYTYLDAVIPIVTEYDSLNSICVANEPYFYANVNSAYYLDDYHAMLKEKYGTVAKMNEAYGGTSYSDFSDVTMPADTSRTSAERQKIAYFNDYVSFNQSIMTDYHKALYDKIKLLAPDTLVHTKAMEYIQTIGNSANLIQLGINMEELSEFFEINGCDAWSYYGAEKDTLIGKLMWYDYLTSVENAPVFNTEDHILKDSSTLSRSNDELKYNMADIWQGAIHGRGGTVLWLWDNTARTGMGSGYYNANLTRRADYIAEIGRVSLDLNRLSDEITAIQKKDARVGMLYSQYSLIQNPYALNASSFAYERIIAHGEKLQFITETEPETLNAGNIELLIIPCSNYMKESTLKEIKTFIDNGGKVLFLNVSGKAWLNEVGKEHDATLLESVKSRSEEVSFSLGYDMYTYDTRRTIDNKLREVLAELSHEVEVTSRNRKVEWSAAEYNGDMIINLCNLSDEYTTVTLSTNAGYDVSNAVDLITGKVVGESFNLDENTPMLIKVEGSKEFTFYDLKTDEVTEKVTSGLKVAVRASSDNKSEEAVLMAAVYKNERLVEVFKRSVTSDENGNFIGELEFNISDTDLSGVSVKAFLVESLKNLKPHTKTAEISY